ncbi:MAG: magnesium and cobalt transport protein CorA [Chitinophagaceae bacterium]
MLKPQNYIRSLVPSYLFGTQRTKDILIVNPTISTTRQDADTISVFVYNYDANFLEERQYNTVEETFNCKHNGHISWINIDGIRKADVEAVSNHFGIHPLLTEDILSMHQRPKGDDLDGVIFCLLYMLYYNDHTHSLETEQISIVLGKDFVISFQDDPTRDVFNPIREKLKLATSKIRQRGADYLFYSMLDIIVDNYFIVMEKIGEQIETVEDEILRNEKQTSLARINLLRKELIVLKRNVVPVRDLVSFLYRLDSDLMEAQTNKYFKDVQDHITQAYELSENYRDVIMSMQDLYINNVNLRMNEVMKVIAIVTCLLAPATVIGGIFGMNFDQNVNFFHKSWGFYTAVALMLLIPIWMLNVFKKRGWF